MDSSDEFDDDGDDDEDEDDDLDEGDPVRVPLRESYHRHFQAGELKSCFVIIMTIVSLQCFA